jgi:RNA polymerase sigma-70 factor (ECF subfamily)
MERNQLGPADRAALARLREGDPGVFQTMVRPLLPSMLALARRLLGDVHRAEDLVQDTLVRAFKGIGGFRGEASLRTWLFRIQVREAAQIRRAGREQAPQESPEFEIPDHLAADPEERIRERELAERLDEAMERLTPRQRTALHLRAVEGLDYAAIATVLGGSAAASRMLVLAARRRVLRRMGRYLRP